jgi:hypothetical protein
VERFGSQWDSPKPPSANVSERHPKSHSAVPSCGMEAAILASLGAGNETGGGNRHWVGAPAILSQSVEYIR